MKANLYYRSLMRRENIIKNFFLSLFDFWASGSRLLLEVFIRKDFGERYFRLSAAMILIVEFGLLPFLFVFLQRKFGAFMNEAPAVDVWSDEPAPVAEPVEPSLWAGYIGWYIFLGLFLLFSIKHYLDKKRQPSSFDFQKFSLYSGTLQPYMLNIPFFKTENNRFRECIAEPLVFAVIGILLILIHQHIGWLILICSFLYGMSYVASYQRGDNFVLDIIDEKISNEEMERSFVDGLTSDDTRGFEFRGQRPSSKQYRRDLLPSIIVDDTDIDFDPSSDFDPEPEPELKPELDFDEGNNFDSDFDPDNDGLPAPEKV